MSPLGAVVSSTMVNEQASQQVKGQIISVSGKFPIPSGNANFDLLLTEGNPDVVCDEGGSRNKSVRTASFSPQKEHLPLNSLPGDVGLRNPRVKRATDGANPGPSGTGMLDMLIDRLCMMDE
jgi:hypothetical protein